MISCQRILSRLLALTPLLLATGCPMGDAPVEILLVNLQSEVEVRSLRLYDLQTPVSDNLLDTALPAMHNRRISIPFENTLAADSIGVSFARPGEDVALSFLPDNVEGGFAPGKVIVFVLEEDGAFDVPSG